VDKTKVMEYLTKLHDSMVADIGDTARQKQAAQAGGPGSLDYHTGYLNSTGAWARELSSTIYLIELLPEK
jgi:hypothetical protein